MASRYRRGDAVNPAPRREESHLQGHLVIRRMALLCSHLGTIALPASQNSKFKIQNFKVISD